MSKIAVVKQIGGSWMIPLPKTFCEVTGIKAGRNTQNTICWYL